VQRIEHHVLLANNGQALKAQSWGRENGFETSEIQESVFENQKSYSVDFVREMPLDLNQIDRDRRRIEDFSMSLDVDYDGWGAAIVP
jgi:regulator of RNase E activity RraB